MDAVESYLATNWSATAVLSVNQDAQTPADGSPFLVTQYPVANEQHIGMAAVGQRSFRESGVIRLVLSAPRGQGRAQALIWCDQLRALFRAKVIGSGVTCRMPSPPNENNANDVGNYYVLSIAIPYYFDLIA